MCNELSCQIDSKLLKALQSSRIIFTIKMQRLKIHACIACISSQLKWCCLSTLWLHRSSNSMIILWRKITRQCADCRQHHHHLWLLLVLFSSHSQNLNASQCHEIQNRKTPTKQTNLTSSLDGDLHIKLSEIFVHEIELFNREILIVKSKLVSICTLSHTHFSLLLSISIVF
jgi:hypothetical protein